MTNGWFSYTNAVKILGAETGLVDALDRLTGGLLLAATGGGSQLALSLFDAKGELARLSRQLGTGLGARLRGLDRFSRTQRIAAAHTVIAVTAFFEAAAEGSRRFSDDELRLLRQEELAIAGGEGTEGSTLGHLVQRLLRMQVPCPSPASPYESVLQDLESHYAELGSRLKLFITGLRQWESMDKTRRDRHDEWLTTQLPAEARERYADLFHRFEAEVPEVAYWSNRIDHQATREKLDAGLSELRRLLESVGSGSKPHGVRDALSRTYRLALDKPILSATELPAGVTIPSLSDAYISPCFRLAAADSAARPAEDRWWAELPVQADLRAFLFGHLTHPGATRFPLLVLGQPGAGKSILTKVLAAELPAGEFAVVRVPLREVPMEADLQTQIEHALRQATGEHHPWTSIYETGVVAVVLLDGFDELLQATRIGNSDYLERVAAFQEREAAHGRPTAVIVTSRTAVADRARVPLGSAMIRLEPFQQAQIAQWVSIWNRTNTADMDTDVVQSLGELTAQPLLLLLLALYDAEGDPLRREGELARAELYERLLVRFARREVMKYGSRLSEAELNQAIDRELLRLSVVAFGMFNRDSQWITEDELEADLQALLPEPPVSSRSFQPTLSASQLAVGRFFFVHEAQALQDERRLKTYEFLHATFGEYLVARLIAQEVRHLLAQAQLSAPMARRTSPDDAFLHALLSHTPLSSRESIPEFLHELLRELPEGKELLLGMFRDALMSRTTSTYDAYQPGRIEAFRTVPARLAAYSVNLLLLLILAAGQVTGGELFDEPPYVIARWRGLARFWQSQISYNAWFNLIHTIDLERTGAGEARDVMIRWAAGRLPALPDVDPYWTYHSSDRGTHAWMHNEFQPSARQLHFICGYEEDALLHTLQPIAEDLSRSIVTFAGFWPDRAVSPANALLRLWLLSSRRAGLPELAAAYVECLHLSQAFAPFAQRDAHSYLDLVLGHLNLDAHRLRGVLHLHEVPLDSSEPELVERIQVELTRLGFR
ncbi:NACHT N-terminal helical domain 7-containing protein [[Actinomadura] parvosata]|uniref:NACHT N-terminal helical domain 7-containing protein n=1 Tax=[Actinomadura] parvosata TaxID=1955412 RepID=UPI00406C3AFC